MSLTLTDTEHRVTLRLTLVIGANATYMLRKVDNVFCGSYIILH